MDNTFPVILGCGVFDSREHFPAQICTPRRQVLHYEAELFIEDGGTAVVNEQAFPIKRGNLLLAKPGDVRYSHLHFKTKYIHFQLFDEESVALLQSLPSLMDANLFDVLSPYFDMAYEAMISVKSFRNISMASAVLRLICKMQSLQEKSRENCLRNDSNTPIQIALQYMLERYGEPLDTPEIAKACGLSVSHFYRKFFAAMEIQPIAYLNKIRIMQAKKQLLENDKPLHVIARECGFASQSYFSRVFKSIVGISPVAYRKSAQHPIV